MNVVDRIVSQNAAMWALLKSDGLPSEQCMALIDKAFPKSEWKVTDPQRVADGRFGTTFHKTRKEAERRVAMFPGSIVERA